MMQDSPAFVRYQHGFDWSVTQLRYVVEKLLGKSAPSAVSEVII